MSQTIATRHTDMIHDAAFDYYAKRLATCSSDAMITVYDIGKDGAESTETAVLPGHQGPVWEVAWAHPKFGSLLASCGYDHRVIIHKEVSENSWTPVHQYTDHESSVNSVAWAPHEHELVLACASSDGKVSVLTHKDDDSWDPVVIDDSSLGCNSVTWAPYNHLGATAGDQVVKRIATGSCDNIVRIYKFSPAEGAWKCEHKLDKGHSDWVRDVAWAPSSGMPYNLLASCSEDQTVVIWKQTEINGEWDSFTLPKFGAPVWRLSWSVTGNTLAVTSGDQAVTLWKESLDGKWMPISEVTQQGATAAGSTGAGAGAGAGAALQ